MPEPIEEQYRASMNELAHLVDQWLNGPLQPGVPRKLGFVLLVSEFGKIEDGRVNYISNGDRESMLAMLHEILARLEGRAMDAPARRQ